MALLKVSVDSTTINTDVITNIGEIQLRINSFVPLYMPAPNIADLISTDKDNQLTLGTDGKLYVSKCDNCNQDNLVIVNTAKDTVYNGHRIQNLIITNSKGEIIYDYHT